MSDKRLGRWWLAAIVFGLTRLVVIDYPSLVDDPDAYRAIAEGWSATGTMGRLSEDGHAAPTAYRPPIYPWLLSWLVKVDGLWLPGVAALHILLGSLTCVLTFDLTRRLSSRFIPSDATTPEANTTHDAVFGPVRRQPLFLALRKWRKLPACDESVTASWRLTPLFNPDNAVVPWLAGFAVALDPILVRQSSLIMTETSAAFLSILIWWVWVVTLHNSGRASPFWFALIGVLLGISCLLRPSTLAWCALLLVALSVRAWRLPKSKQPCNFSFFNVIFLVVGIVSVLSPWAIRNRIEFGSTIWTTTHGGYTLLLANNPVLFRHLDDEGISRKWDEDRFHERWSMRSQRDPTEVAFWSDKLDVDDATTDRVHNRFDEIADDRLANQVAWQTIIQSPWTFAKACFARILWLWALWPFQEIASLILTILIGAWYLVVFSFFAFGCGYGFWKWSSARYSAKAELEWLPAVTLIIGLTAVHFVYWSNMRMRGPMMPMIVMIAVIGISKIPFRRSVSYTKRSVVKSDASIIERR